jgi:hypothetical protein
VGTPSVVAGTVVAAIPAAGDIAAEQYRRRVQLSRGPCEGEECGILRNRQECHSN